MDLTKLKVFVDVHNVGVKSNDADKSEGVKFCWNCVDFVNGWS